MTIVVSEPQSNKPGQSVWIRRGKIEQNSHVVNPREPKQPIVTDSILIQKQTKSRVPRMKQRIRSALRSAIVTAGDFAAYSTVRLLVAGIQTLPTDMGDTMCHSLARIATGPIKIRQRVTDQNLAQVFPDADAQTREETTYQMWHSLLLMVCEIAWAQRRLHLSNWKQHVTFRQNRTMLKHLLGTRPTVLVTGHYGNFEVGGYVTGLMGINTLAIARKLDNPFLHRWVERFRGAKGQMLIDKNGCAEDVDRHLRDGGILSLLADQHAGDKGCWVNFLGVPASCHKALALFTLSADAPMIVGATRRVNRQPMQFEMLCTGIADPSNDEQQVCQSVKSLTEWYNGRLAVAILPAVEQYWWLHRRWRNPPERVAKRLRRAA
jgi:KDO2-lipid IV(A) lauroyltransferase